MRMTVEGKKGIAIENHPQISENGNENENGHFMKNLALYRFQCAGKGNGSGRWRQHHPK